MDEDMKVPPFARMDGESLVFSGEGEMQFYIPEQYFDSENAIVEGTFTRLLGSFVYRVYSKNGTPGKLGTFNWPTFFMCKPSSSEKKKNLVLDEGFQPGNFRVLHFVDGAQLVANIYTPQDIDNVKKLMSLHIMTGKIPNILKYNELYDYLYNALSLNDKAKFDVHSQLMSLVYSKICRDPADISRPFRLSKAINENLRAYTTLSVRDVPKYVSPYVAITSENMDESIIASVLLTDKIKKGKREHTHSPLEKVMTM